MARDITLINTIAQILRQEQVHNHQELCDILHKQGFDVTQSSISRILRKLGAMKGINAAQESVYVLPKEALSKELGPFSPPTDFTPLILSIAQNEQLIVINTTPGSANMIAHLLDRNRTQCHVLGTIAGDDTILVIPTSVVKLTETLQAVSQFLS